MITEHRNIRNRVTLAMINAVLREHAVTAVCSYMPDLCTIS